MPLHRGCAGWSRVVRMSLVCACAFCVRSAVATDVAIDRIMCLAPDHVDIASIGEKIEIVLGGKLPTSGRTAVRFGSALAIGAQVVQNKSYDSIQVTVPAMSGTAGVTPQQVSVLIDGTAVGTPAIFPILIPGSPQVTAIESIPDPAGQKLTVRGHDLFGPPVKLNLSFGDVSAAIDRVASDGSWFQAHMKGTVEQGSRIAPVKLTVWDAPATINEKLPPVIQREASLPWMLVYTLAPLLVLCIIIYLIALKIGSRRVKNREDQRRRSWLYILLVDSRTNTYSLSIAQFYWWLLIIACGYSWMFVTRGMLADRWEWPSIEGAPLTLLISLGTAVGAEWVAQGIGTKGAGDEEPRIADLFVHGNVLAPERVQQALWTLIAGGIFIILLTQSYRTADKLPQLPTDLLVLMGFSSAGYLGGKLVRGPGPVIDTVKVADGSLLVSGTKLSLGPRDGVGSRVRVFLDQSEVPATDIKTVETDPGDPKQFAKVLTIKPTVNPTAKTIRVVNEDGQEAVVNMPPPQA